ncbi:DUF2281 domain-containing protein [Pedobacter nototheniae]|uniref:DUF2281 domain-containing protein n=1 Tax=Pedobacter nototheniae TaxID=2488994 RepID=UPI00103A6D4A|nr:DUF2281 domain-containing protein [Pedobacter nototheniae]
MKDLKLYLDISSLPSNLKEEVSDFVEFLKQKSKQKRVSENLVEEPMVAYTSKFSDILLNGPVFSDEQIQTIEETRKSINKWRTK